MTTYAVSEAAKAVVRRNTEEVWAKIHWQAADGDLVTTFKKYHGTHRGMFLGIAPTGRRIHFELVDAMRVRDGRIVEHWEVGNLLSMLHQLVAISLAAQG